MNNMKKSNEVNELINKGWIYSASIKYAEDIFNNPKLNSDITNVFDNDSLVKIIHNANDNYNKIINIISYGNKWNEDELLLVFTHMVELVLLDNLFEKNDFVLGLNMVQLSHEINNIDLIFHEKEIQFVKKSFNKNWKGINAVKILEDFLEGNGLN